MHRCLQLDEIFSNVLDHVLAIDYREISLYPYSGASTLLAIAQTCRQLSDHALNRLWYRLDGLSKLIQCLPRDAWVIEQRSGPKIRELRLKRDLTREDLNRLYFYSHRVRVLDTREDAWREASLHHLVIPTILSRRTHDVHLTPNLEQLVVSLTEFTELAWNPAAVVSPNLKVMQLWLSGHWYQGEPSSTIDASWRNFGLLLSRVARTIETVSIDVDDEIENEPFDVKSPDGLISFLRRLKHIQKLETIHVEVTAKLLRRFLAHRTLKTLAFTMYAAEMEEFIEATDKLPEYICDLESLTMRIDDLDLCYRLLSQVAHSSLKSLGLARHSPGHMENQLPEELMHVWDVDLLLADLSQKDFLANLTEIEIIHPRTFNVQANETPVISCRTLEPLLQIRTLQIIRLSLYGRVDIDGEVLKVMSCAWPDLRILSLRERTVGTIPRVSLLDILSFTASSSKLYELYIRFDATQEHYEVKDLQGFSQCRTLDILDVCTSPIKNAQIVAQLLTVALPNLSQVMYGWLYDDVPGWDGDGEEFRTPTEVKYCDAWEEVLVDMHVA